NAIKFSEAGGEIWITVEKQQSEVLFKVKDQGRGIPTDKLQTIFERFQQVDASDSRKKGGTGLGLAICRHIVEQHNGKIWVESIYGQGSSFCFTLPQ
ncbi:MAG: sensor histidine kinase, partial [Waterburya sp.]